MVELSGRAGWLIVNSRLVKLEGFVGSINGDRDRGHGNGVLEGVFITRADISEAGEGSTNVVGRVLAGVRSSSGVWVAGFSIETTVGDNVLEGLVHQTTVATLVSLGRGAVDEILFRERDEVSFLQKPSTFSRSGSRE